MKKTPKLKIDVLEKLSRKQIIGTVLSIVVTLISMIGVYEMEYCVDVTNTASLESTANQTLDFFAFDADFLESIRVGRTLFVQFQDKSQDAKMTQAVMQLERGLFGKYRVRSTIRSNFALYINQTTQVGFKHYLIISGVNDPVGANTFRLYKNDRLPAYEGEACENNVGVSPIYQGKTAPQFFIVEEISKEVGNELHWPFAIRYYDTEGKEIAVQDIAAHYNYDGSKNIGGGCAHAPTTLYTLLTIILLLGIIFVRYFITPENTTE